MPCQPSGRYAEMRKTVKKYVFKEKNELFKNNMRIAIKNLHKISCGKWIRARHKSLFTSLIEFARRIYAQIFKCYIHTSQITLIQRMHLHRIMWYNVFDNAKH